MELGVGQLIEIGGKRGARSDAANARLRATESSLARQSQLIALDARRTFALVLIAEQRVKTANEADSIGADLLRYAQERLELGVGTTLDVNVAAASSARDKRQRLAAEQLHSEALLDFRAAIGVPLGSDVRPDGTIDLPTMPSQTEDALVAAGVAKRPDLVAVTEERVAAEAERRYARALAVPDPSLGLSIGRDDFRSKMFTVGIQVPLWHRAEGSRIAAGAAVERATSVEQLARRDVEREVRQAYGGLARTIEAARSFERDVIATLGANLELARQSLENGKISLITYNTVRRELIAARLEYFDALAEVLQRRYELAAATGGAWE
jgi:cobalt-zinc-cadmium efflux system outer membrane protein